MSNHILVIIDDEPLIRDSLSLAFPEFTFSEAQNGEDGLRLLQHNTAISMVFLDYHMPGMNGIDTLKSIKKHHPNLNVIMVTGNPKVTKDAILNGADGLVEKPLDFDELQELVWATMDPPHKDVTTTIIQNRKSHKHRRLKF